MPAPQVPNRFVAGIRSGEIDSLEDLKAAFKELAKATHPDLSGGGSGDEFVLVRSEYEKALYNYEYHRFGAAKAAAMEGSPVGGATVDPRELWACLTLFLKRGFPKVPRHEKEILRYEYARWRFRGALRSLGGRAGSRTGSSGGHPEADAVKLFDRCEAGLLEIRKSLPEGVGSCLVLLRGLVAHAEREHPAMRTALVRELESLRLEAGLGPDIQGFLELLAGELGIGRRLG
jgi:hypothetical protein